MDSVRVRELNASDLSAVTPLLDASLGVGFWNGDDLSGDVALVAEANGVLVGVGAAGLDAEDSGAVGHIRLVAVEPAWRRRGIATTLVHRLIERCEALGATSHRTYAWVYGSDGIAPMANVLAEAGFRRSRRIEGFYSSMAGGSCPACHRSPCVCPADLYVRSATEARS